jgi:cytochrome bd-type quinol oxidase subunit 1
VLGPQVANQLGWMAAEVGRQPWIVYKLMRTADGLSPVVKAPAVLFSLVLFSLIYALLFALFLFHIFMGTMLWLRNRQARPQKYEVLANSFLFRNLSTAHLEKIVSLSRVMQLPAQQVVFETAATGEEMFVVLNGRLKISVANRDGREIVLPKHVHAFR